MPVIVSKDNSAQEVLDVKINLKALDQWGSLNQPQQKFLTKLTANPMKPRTIALELGYVSQYNQWVNEPEFTEICDLIREVYLEQLKSIDYIDALGNSKIRGRVIKAQENKGKYTEERKGTEHKHIHIGYEEFMKRIQSGN
jgi:hypothetical protein